MRPGSTPPASVLRRTQTSIAGEATGDDGAGRFAVVRSTRPEAAPAEAAARRLAERRLAAGVAMLPGMVSVHRREGAIERAEEVAMPAETRADLAEAATAAIAEVHSYAPPALLVVPVATAARAYGA